jgi:hypothetical protein
MRIRTVKPEFWKSESNGRLSRDARLLFIGLFNHSDDEGRFRASPSLIRAELFPYDDITLETVHGWLRELSVNNHKIVIYKGPDGDQYGWIPSFKLHQLVNRPQASKLPEYKGDLTDSLNDHGLIKEGSLLDCIGKEGNGSGNGMEGSAEGAAPVPVAPVLPPVPVVKKQRPRKTVPLADNPPTLEEVTEYVKSKGYDLDPQYFIDKMQSKAWRDKNDKPLYDWQATIRTWMSYRNTSQPSEHLNRTPVKSLLDPELGKISTNPDGTVRMKRSGEE